MTYINQKQIFRLRNKAFSALLVVKCYMVSETSQARSCWHENHWITWQIVGSGTKTGNRLNSVKVSGSCLAFEIFAFPQSCSVDLQQLFEGYFLLIYSTLEDWYNDQKYVMLWLVIPVLISKVILEEGWLMTSQSKFLNYSILLPIICSAATLSWQGITSHCSQQLSKKKKSQVFVQELEKLHQHFLSNGDDHAFLEKKKKKRLTYWKRWVGMSFLWVFFIFCLLL